MHSRPLQSNHEAKPGWLLGKPHVCHSTRRCFRPEFLHRREFRCNIEANVRVLHSWR